MKFLLRSDCARSPKDKRSRESRDSEHRTNHDRSGGEVSNKNTFFTIIKKVSFAIKKID